MWHKMTIIGKVLLFLVGFGFGLATGFYHGSKQVPNEGNQINVSVDGKVKDEGAVQINVEGNDQKTEDKKEKKKFLGIF